MSTMEKSIFSLGVITTTAGGKGVSCSAADTDRKSRLQNY